MVVSDLSKMHKWLNNAFLAQYWKDPATLDDVNAKYEPYVMGKVPTTPYIMIIDGNDIGYIQTYYYSDHMDSYYDLLEVSTFTAGVDLFIGEENYIHKGYGVHIMREFIRKHVFSNPQTTEVMVTPEPNNAVAIKVYEKVGFMWYKTITTPSEEREFLMSLSRENFMRSYSK